MAKIKITKTTVQELPFPEKGQALYWDEELPGFGIRVSRKVKCYFVQMRVKGKFLCREGKGLDTVLRGIRKGIG